MEEACGTHLSCVSQGLVEAAMSQAVMRSDLRISRCSFWSRSNSPLVTRGKNFDLTLMEDIAGQRPNRRNKSKHSYAHIHTNRLVFWLTSSLDVVLFSKTTKMCDSIYVHIVSYQSWIAYVVHGVGQIRGPIRVTERFEILMWFWFPFFLRAGALQVSVQLQSILNGLIFWSILKYTVHGFVFVKMVSRGNQLVLGLTW